MRESGALAKFDRLQAAWSAWVYSLSKAEALTTEVVVGIRSKGGDEKARCWSERWGFVGI